MEKYSLYVNRDTLEKIKKCATACIDHQTWLPVEVLGDFVGANLSDLFGAGDLGWSPFTLQYDFQLMDNPRIVCVSVPKPEEIPTCPGGRTVRDRMEDLASSERPTLKDRLTKNGIGIHSDTVPYEKAYIQDALAVLRHLNEAPYSLYPELIEQLTEMRTIIHTMIGTGENCCDEPDNEYPEAIRKATRLDVMDAFSYAIWESLVCAKDDLAAKKALNSIYGTTMYAGSGLAEALKRSGRESLSRLSDIVNGCSECSDTALPDSCESENVRAPEPNALFVTIETGAFEVTPENIEAVNSFISNACDGRDIHLRIV